MIDKTAKEIERLLTAAKESRLVIFVGAGVSMGTPTNLPSWGDVNRIVVRSLAKTAGREIGDTLAEKAAETILTRHQHEKLPPAYQAQVLAEFLHNKYFEVLRFIDSDRPNASHLAIALLARLGCVRAIVTTNFDRLIETAFAALGVQLVTHYKPDHFATLANDLGALDHIGAATHLLKLHGSVDDPKTLIDTLAQRKRGFQPAVLKCARHLLDTGHWLFLGFSGLDLEAEPNYLSLSQRADSAMGFTWLVRQNMQPRPAVTRLKSRYGDRGAILHGELPDWLLDFTSLISPDPPTSIAEQLPQDFELVSPAAALERGAGDWATGLTPGVCALSLGLLTLACAQPQEAATVVQALLESRAQRSSKAATAKGNLLMRAVVTNTLGTVLAGLGRHEAAIARFNEAIDLAAKADDVDTRDRFRSNLAISLEALGQIDEARAMHESILASYRERDDPMPIAFGLNNLAALSIRQLRLDDAERFATEALDWSARAGDERLRVTALNELGMIAKLRGDYPHALEKFGEVAAFFEWVGDDAAAAAAAGNKGEILVALARFDEAEPVLRSVLRTNERLEQLENQGATMLSLGALSHARGDADEAEEWFTSARSLFQAIGNPANEARALFQLATLQNERGQFEKAADTAQSGLPLVSGKNDAFTADLWFQRGRANLSLGQIGSAEEAFREAIVLAERVGATRVVAAATQNLGTALLLVQRDREAADAFANARDLWRALGEDAAAVAYCALCESAVELDAKVAALSEAGHAATDWGERQLAAREMFGLYPDLIALYEQIGATQLVASFCVSAASTAHFIEEDAHAVDWFTRGGVLYRDIGAADRARDAFGRAERILQYHVNALLQRSQMEDAMPLLLQLANVSGELGHHEAQATAMYNAAIGAIGTAGDYERARVLASEAADLFDAESASAENARRLAAFCLTELQRGTAGGGDGTSSPVP